MSSWSARATRRLPARALIAVAGAAVAAAAGFGSGRHDNGGAAFVRRFAPPAQCGWRNSARRFGNDRFGGSGLAYTRYGGFLSLGLACFR